MGNNEHHPQTCIQVGRVHELREIKWELNYKAQTFKLTWQLARLKEYFHIIEAVWKLFESWYLHPQNKRMEISGF